MTDVSTDSGPQPVQGGIFGGMAYQPLGWGDPTGSSPAQNGAGASALGPQSPLAPGLGDIQSQVQASTAQERQALAGPMSKLNAAQQGRPQTPNLQTSNEPPPDAKEYQKNAMEWASAFAVLGAIAGRFTRAPGGAALGAFASAVKGWQSGNLQAYESASKEWEEKNKQTIQNNKTLMEKYKLELENSNKNIDEQMTAIQIIAAQYHDPLMYQAAGSKNFTLVGQIYEKNVFQTDKAERAAGILSATRRNEEAQQAVVGERVASGQIDPDGVNPQTGQPWTEANKQYFKYTKEQYLLGAYNQGKKSGGVSGIRLSQRNEIISNLTQSLGRRPTEDEISDEVAAQAGKVAAARVTASAEPRALSGALTQLTKQQAAINSFEKTAVANGKVLTQLADKVDKTGVPVIERWIRAGRQATGDADVANFHAQMALYRAEVAKIITNPNLTGVLSDSARKEAEEFLSGSASAKQIKSVIKLLEGDMGRREQSIVDEINDIKSQLKSGGGGSATPAPSAAPAAADAPTFSDRFTGSTAPPPGNYTYDPATGQMKPTP